MIKLKIIKIPKSYVICDGVTGSETGLLFNILYPIFCLTGTSIILFIIVRWIFFKEENKKNDMPKM